MKYIKVFVLAMSVILIPLSGFAAKDAQSYDDYLAQKEELAKAITLNTQNKFSEALPVFRKLKDNLNPAGEYYYAAALHFGQGIGKDETKAYDMYKKVFPYIKSFAKKGDDLAQYIIAKMYSQGWGTEIDTSAAEKWFRKAAEQGNKYAQTSLGQLYEAGAGIKPDFNEAIKWYRKAAVQGDPDGQYKAAAFLYRFGETEAVEWYRKAAEQNNASAQYALGEMYDTGKWVLKDADEALTWYYKAGELGNASAIKAIKEKYRSIGFNNTAVAEKWKTLGFTFADMQNWGPKFAPTEVKEWMRLELDNHEAAGCKNGGYSTNDITDLVKTGAQIADLKQICASIPIDQKLEWETKFELEEYLTWSRDFTFEEAFKWKNAGYSAEKAWKMINNLGLNSPAAATRFNRACPKGFESIDSLIQTNPYDVAGKCFDFVGETKQILSKSTALFTIAGQTFYLDFGKGSAPKMYFKGFAKGVGVYEYTTVLGAVQKVPHLKSVIRLK